MNFRQWMEAWAARTPAWKGLRDYMRDPQFSVGDTYHLFRKFNYGEGPGIDEFGDVEHAGKGLPEDFDYEAVDAADEFLRKNPRWKEEREQAWANRPREGGIDSDEDRGVTKVPDPGEDTPFVF